MLTMHVDDGSMIPQSDALIDEAKVVLQKRYGLSIPKNQAWCLWVTSGPQR
jgi:hypothetical protein